MADLTAGIPVIHCAGIFSRVGLVFCAGEETEIGDRTAVAAERDGVLVTQERVKGNLPGYATSKFALLALCQTMRHEGWNAGIRVTAICPGWVNTTMATAVPPDAMTQPEELATLTSTLLQLPAAAVPFELAVNCVLEN